MKQGVNEYFYYLFDFDNFQDLFWEY